MAVYVVNDFYTSPKKCTASYGTESATVDQVGSWLARENLGYPFDRVSTSIYFEFDSEEDWLTDDVLQQIEELEKERCDFLHFFVRGFEDVFFYGYGFADQAMKPGYEEGHVLGMHAPEEMDFEGASKIGQLLWDARLKMENTK